jgi:hypothetical protein
MCFGILARCIIVTHCLREGIDMEEASFQKSPWGQQSSRTVIIFQKKRLKARDKYRLLQISLG